MDLELYDKDPMSPRLSGLPLEYRILTIYSRDRGQRSAAIGFDVGQGTQDIGFRNEMTVLFNALPAQMLRLGVRDENGAPTVAAFTIRDGLGRLYPNPAKRLAPDLFFQPQVYRENGAMVLVPAGSYTVTASMGPEYQPQTKKIEVTATGSNEISFAMQRWIDPPKIPLVFRRPSCTCSGLLTLSESDGRRADRKIWCARFKGEKLNVGAVLTWGPCYYYQKHFSAAKIILFPSRTS